MSEQAIEVPFELYYDVKQGIPIEEAIEQLKAISKIINRQKIVINELTDATFDRAEIFVTELKEGSWLEKICIKLFFENEESFEKFKAACGDTPMKLWLKLVLAMGVGAFLWNTIDQTLNPKETKPTVNIEINNNSGIVSLGKSIDLTDDQINKVIEKNAKLSKADKQAALDVISPAKNGGASQIQFTGFEELNIPKTSFENIPDEVPNQEGKEREVNYSNIDIYIYASDRDKATNGWAGIVPDLFENRVKFELGEDIKPDSLHGRRKVKADIVVHETFNKTKKEYKPYKVTILKTN